MNITYNDFNQICRTCMFNCDVKFALNNVILDIINKLADIHDLETNEELPQQLCFNCFEKINEIIAFASRCKETYSSLVKCLNNVENNRLKQEQDIIGETNEPLLKEDDIKIEFVQVDEINSAKNYIIDEVLLKKEITENTDCNDENCSENDLFITNICKVVIKNENNEEASDEAESEHSGEHPFNCKRCSKSFTQMAQLREHMATHNNGDPYVCKLCSKTFTQSNGLRIHMRRHSNDRPYKCEQCLKSFLLPSRLREHMRTHSGERPFKCNLCPKSFIRSSVLIIHMRTHSGERPYKCNECKKSFIQSNHLKVHMRTHNAERSY